MTDWQHIDAELLNLVRNHGSGSFEDIHLRVVFMNGVYRAQLSRTIGENADFVVAQALHAQWRRVTNAISPLNTFAAPSVQAMVAVVSAHKVIVEVLQNAFPDRRRATSFASKFLWPDATHLVPIFDSRTVEHSRQRRSDFAAAVGPLRNAMGNSHDEYFEHAVRYMATYQTLSTATLPANVPLTMKGIDHMYWLS
jgi:hypothetical protein